MMWLYFRLRGNGGGYDRTRTLCRPRNLLEQAVRHGYKDSPHLQRDSAISRSSDNAAIFRSYSMG